ncbi:hypothetical protein P4N68_12685 [Corynebacterium felinum]|uniref:ABC transporter ATP-binding protein n=1 Tax=Corynebacterium felinum TaxID=131318 RepID=A0ABU2BCS8_9CORY|nr:hypothetical protein [Corynebacterium felinum]MDF5821924.1 hypothetical protein [Corynebacterium felinum]MDR7355784.1 hypothetical protein [Corynebacterium felinum]WJY95130.1 hypothetical protein CFELI_07580 [Corynebacterium felinum]
MNNIITVEELTVISGVTFPNFSLPREGLTLIKTQREQSATTLSMTIVGRMHPQSGRVVLHTDSHDLESSRQRFFAIAFAGVPEIDTLERLVPVRSVIREQAAWHLPWYKLTPRSIDNISSYVHAAQVVGFHPFGGDFMSNEQAKTLKVNDLNPSDRFLLRVVLAIMARPDAAMLLVDDLDQVRSLELRDHLLRELKKFSAIMPVVVFSCNPDSENICDTVIDLSHLSYSDNPARLSTEDNTARYRNQHAKNKRISLRGRTKPQAMDENIRTISAAHDHNTEGGAQ